MSTWYANAPYTNVPEQHRWNLVTLYGVFVIAVALLYPACRWYANRKRDNPAWWMKLI